MSGPQFVEGYAIDKRGYDASGREEWWVVFYKIDNHDMLSTYDCGMFPKESFARQYLQLKRDMAAVK
jgi:hypothetical protein